MGPSRYLKHHLLLGAKKSPNRRRFLSIFPGQKGEVVTVVVEKFSGGARGGDSSPRILYNWVVFHPLYKTTNRLPLPWTLLIWGGGREVFFFGACHGRRLTYLKWRKLPGHLIFGYFRGGFSPYILGTNKMFGEFGGFRVENFGIATSRNLGFRLFVLKSYTNFESKHLFWWTLHFCRDVSQI